MSPVGVDGKIGVEGEIYFSDNYWNKLDEMMRKAAGEREALGWYQIKPFKLDNARTNERIAGFPEDGDCVLALSLNGSAEIKLNSPNSDAFDLEVYERINHYFEDLYLTNSAQPGKVLKLLIGKGDWGLTETIPEIDLSGTVRNDYLEQITDPLKIGQIIEDGHIKPHADIACEKILISGATRLDDWRSTDDYTYMDPGRILLHATTKLSDWRHPTDLTLINGGQIFTHSIEANKLSILTHILSGATWIDNSPVAGFVAWTGATLTYNGITYPITDGNTNQAYIWWDLDNPTSFQTSNVKPIITDDDCIVVYNNAGTHELVWNATLIEGRTLRTGTITAAEIAALTIIAGNITAGAVTADKIAAVNADISTITAGGGVITIDATGITAILGAITMFQLSAATGDAYFKGKVIADGGLVLPVGVDKWAT